MKKCVLTIAGILLPAWIAAAQEVPKVGVYVGYQYVRFNPSHDISSFNLNGGSSQFIYNFNNWLGGVADLGGVHNRNINGFGVDSTMGNFLFGPRVSIRKAKRVTPYFQALFGVVYAAASTRVIGVPDSIFPGFPTLLPGNPITARLSTTQTAFAMTAGGGLDIKINKHVTFRPIAVDYYMTRLQNFVSEADDRQDNIRYSAGFTFWFGGPKAVLPPQQPKTKVCPNGTTVALDATCPKMNLTLALNANPSELCPGETSQVIPTIAGASPNQLGFVWSLNGQQISQKPTFEFGSTGRDPGNYTVTLNTVSDKFNAASASTSITVREYHPPTGTVQASPASLRDGEKSTLTASFTGQCGGPIQPPVFEASEGTIHGDQFECTGVQWDSSNNAEQRKSVTITAKASDNKNTGTATTTVECVRAAMATPIRLPDVLFSPNSARVNNCGKRILLEQLRAYYERDATGTVVVVGHNSSDETVANLAEQRAMNSAAVITAGSGICLSIPQSQVQVSAPGVEQNGVSFEPGFCQASVGGSSAAKDMRRVVVWFVPTGGQLPPSVTKSAAASTLSVGSLGCPK